KASEFATMSPYLGMGANPNMYVDPDGQELTVFAAIAIGAAIGAGTYTASVGFSDGGFSNWNWGQFALGVGIGGLSGAASFGVGEAFKGLALAQNGKLTLGQSVLKAGIHGHVQGTLGVAQGGNYVQSFAAGAAGSGFGSAFGEVSGKAGIQFGINAVGGALIGGGASAWEGGDFWEGAAIGATVSVANHWLHRVFDRTDPSPKAKKSLIRKYGDAWRSYWKSMSTMAKSWWERMANSVSGQQPGGISQFTTGPVSGDGYPETARHTEIGIDMGISFKTGAGSIRDIGDGFFKWIELNGQLFNSKSWSIIRISGDSAFYQTEQISTFTINGKLFMINQAGDTSIYNTYDKKWFRK
ncbi:MAG: hypothetical protein AAGI25_06415, partial [Bacteroidota bacterium]